MTKTINIFLLSFYCFGTLCLPVGDFALLKDLPEMFRHCKATEDKDLNLVEFLTEHVSPIGQLIEGLEHEAEEDGDKPHQPVQNSHHIQLVFSFIAYYTIKSEEKKSTETKPVIYKISNVTSEYITKIFRPPIVA